MQPPHVIRRLLWRHPTAATRLTAQQEAERAQAAERAAAFRRILEQAAERSAGDR